MPVIKTYGGDLPYQAGYKSGKTARQLYDDEKRRQDAKYEAELEFNNKKLNAEKEIQALKIMREKELDVQKQLNFEAELKTKQESNQALIDYRNQLAKYKQADSEIKAKKDAETAKRLANKDMIDLNTKAITFAQKENPMITPEVPTINKYKDLITGKAQSNPYAEMEEYQMLSPAEQAEFLNYSDADKQDVLNFLKSKKGKK